MAELTHEILKDFFNRELEEAEKFLTQKQSELRLADTRYKLALTQRDKMKEKIKSFDKPSQ